MGSDEPLTVSVIFLRHVLCNISLIIISWQIQRIRCRNIVVNKWIIFNYTKSLLWVKFLIRLRISEKVFEWTLILFLLLLRQGFSFKSFLIIESVSFEFFGFNLLEFESTLVKVWVVTVVSGVVKIVNTWWNSSLGWSWW